MMAAAAKHFPNIVIGAGIAGLTVALELAKRGEDVVILEQYPVPGGRMLTFREDDIQYEIGAGRIFTHHSRVRALVERYKLHTIPISAETYYQKFSYPPIKNDFLLLMRPFLHVIETLPKSVLANYSLAELFPPVYNPILKMYPYWAEIHMLRADLAIQLFKPKETMGTTAAADYYGIVEGIDSIITKLVAEAVATGITIYYRHRVENIRSITTEKTDTYEIIGSSGKKIEAKPFIYTAKRLIIATSANSYKYFSVLANHPIHKQLGISPLLRIYAVYPKTTTSGRVWFADLPKIVTPGPLRYIIPINPEKGLIMISYTDGKDTAYWESSKDDAELETKLSSQLEKVFPHMEIPKPTFLKKHYWKDGATYWLPGNYNVKQALKSAMNPQPNLYLCGESLSMSQAWIEGALESAESLLKIL